MESGQRQGQPKSKKLAEAAQHWAGKRAAAKEIASFDDNVIDGLVRAGAPAELIEQAKARQQASESQQQSQDDFEVYEENWDAFQFFLYVTGQWNAVAGGLGGIYYMGLSRVNIEAEMNMRGIKPADRVELLNKLNVMEHAAMSELNKVKS